MLTPAETQVVITVFWRHDSGCKISRYLWGRLVSTFVAELHMRRRRTRGAQSLRRYGNPSMLYSHAVIDCSYVRPSTPPCIPMWPVSCWFAAFIFDIEHPHFDQLTHVKTRYPLTSITWPYRGLKFRAHQGQLFYYFFKLTSDQVLIFDWIASLTLFNSPKHKQGFIFARFLWLDAATRPYCINYSSYTVNAFHVQVEKGLKDFFLSAVFAGFNPVWHIMISVVHTGGYAIIQVKHRKDINLKLSVYF